MTASCKLRRALPCRPKNPFFPWSFAKILLMALVVRLPTSFGDCGKPPEFDSMTIKGVPKSSYVIWEKVFYDCKPGYYYKLFSPYNTFCEPNSTWYPIDEACYRKSCPTPKIPNGGVVALQMGFEFDKEAEFYCDDGYYLKGEQILTCKLSGDQVYWNYAVPTCEKIFCQSPGKIENGKHTNSWRNVFEFNELVTYSCDPSNGPEEYSLVGESKLICSGPGKWSSDPPQCKVVKCDYPVLKHGRPVSKIKDKFSYQDEILFQCLEGFYLNGSNPVFCGGNNTWEPEMPTCIKGFKPTHPTKPPVSRYPGYPNPRELPPIEEIVELDPGVIALIIFTILVAIAIICTCLYKWLRRGKKG
ncbi:membrane cofactor protein isoform X2 [Desmodus rotundus]|nr:membrane cofactor protein isoform X2 [Desmodus rotundus]